MNEDDYCPFDTNMKIAKFITPCKTWDISQLQSIVDNDCLQMIIATPIYIAKSQNGFPLLGFIS